MTTAPQDTLRPQLVPPALWLALALNMIWINLSEVFRYFAFVMPMMREAMAMVPGVAPMNVPVFLIWGVWDTVLILSASFLTWLMMERYGPSIRTALAAGTIVWATVFVILWLGLFNMRLAPGSVLAVALPLAWIEMVVAALIVRWSMQRGG